MAALQIVVHPLAWLCLRVIEAAPPAGWFAFEYVCLCCVVVRSPKRLIKSISIRKIATINNSRGHFIIYAYVSLADEHFYRAAKIFLSNTMFGIIWKDVSLILPWNRITWFPFLTMKKSKMPKKTKWHPITRQTAKTRIAKNDYIFTVAINITTWHHNNKKLFSKLFKRHQYND